MDALHVLSNFLLILMTQLLGNTLLEQLVCCVLMLQRNTKSDCKLKYS